MQYPEQKQFRFFVVVGSAGFERTHTRQSFCRIENDVKILSLSRRRTKLAHTHTHITRRSFFLSSIIFCIRIFDWHRSFDWPSLLMGSSKITCAHFSDKCVILMIVFFWLSVREERNRNFVPGNVTMREGISIARASPVRESMDENVRE